MQHGAAQISAKHGNFFINLGDATAADVWALIQLARRQVADQFGVELDLEIELVGDWEAMNANPVEAHRGAEV